MPPPKYKNLKRFNFGLFFSILMLSVFFFSSCVQEPEAPIIKAGPYDQVMKIKSWFEENKQNLRLPEKGINFRTESQELILPFFEKQPNWDKFHHYFFPDGREVYEIALKNSQSFVPVREGKKDQEKLAKRMLQNILFVKHPTENRFDPLIIRYYPDEETSKRDFKKIHYQMVDEKWSGTIDIFTYDEHHFIGFEVDRGQIKSTRQLVPKADGSRKTFGPENMDVRCTPVTTDWYQLSYNYSTGIMTWVQLAPTTSYSCSMSYDSGASSGGYPSYTYIGSSSGISSTSGTPNYFPPDIPLPKLTIEIDSSVSSNSNVNCIVQNLAMSSFVKSIAEFTQTTTLTTNSVLKLGPTANPTGNGQTIPMNGFYEITINSGNLNRPDLLVARSILHELVHAEIFAALAAKGQTPLDNNFASNYNQLIGIYASENPQQWAGDQHHKYMAENLLYKMGAALMDYHKTYMPQDYQGLASLMNYAGGYPKGIPVDFYMNLFWDGFVGTHAFQVMQSITANHPILTPFEKYERDNINSKLLTKPCGN